MPTVTIEYTTEAERLALEQAIAYFPQLRQVAASAPDGTVLGACERLVAARQRVPLFYSPPERPSRVACRGREKA